VCYVQCYWPITAEASRRLSQQYPASNSASEVHALGLITLRVVQKIVKGISSFQTTAGTLCQLTRQTACEGKVYFGLGIRMQDRIQLSRNMQLEVPNRTGVVLSFSGQSGGT